MILTCLFVVQLSIGEAIWSPRTYEYLMSVAPKGREGTYTAVASIPLFASKVPTGLLSGYLLETYCPKDGPCHGQTLWLIIMLFTLASPLLTTLLYKVIYDPIADQKQKVSSLTLLRFPLTLHDASFQFLLSFLW